jgi:GTP cyclohydrolase II
MGVGIEKRVDRGSSRNGMRYPVPQSGVLPGSADPSPGTEAVPGAGVELVTQVRLPTRFGLFTIYGFRDRRDGKEHVAMVHGMVEGREGCPVRIHSECHTGDVWFSLRCDCREQLEASLRYIKTREAGAVVYLRQEGRGIGLLNKLKAYALQDQGIDTVEANRRLGLPADARDYKPAAEILRLLGIPSVSLITNNPDKIQGLEAEGIPVRRRISVVIPSNVHNRKYLETKKQRLGHLLD